MAQEGSIHADDKGFQSFPATPASSKEAISHMILQAASAVSMVKAAPVPSPSRILKSMTEVISMYSRADFWATSTDL